MKESIKKVLFNLEENEIRVDLKKAIDDVCSINNKDSVYADALESCNFDDDDEVCRIVFNKKKYQIKDTEKSKKSLINAIYYTLEKNTESEIYHSKLFKIDVDDVDEAKNQVDLTFYLDLTTEDIKKLIEEYVEEEYDVKYSDDYENCLYFMCEGENSDPQEIKDDIENFLESFELIDVEIDVEINYLYWFNFFEFKVEVNNDDE